MYGKTNASSGSGEKHFATILVTTSDFIGQTVTCTGTDFSQSAVFDSEGEATFTVHDWGNYTVSCGTKSKAVTVDEWYVTFEVELSNIKIVTFADGTWQELIDMVTAHYNDSIDISDYWSVGNERDIEIGNIAAGYGYDAQSAQTLKIVICGFDQDTLETAINGHTKCAVTIGFVTIGTLNLTNTAVGWNEQDLRNWLRENLLPAFPSTLSSGIKNKVSAYNRSTPDRTIIDNLFLPSSIEITGSGEYTSTLETQYTYYQTSANRIKYSTGTTKIDYWLRDVHSLGSYRNRYISMGGSATTSYSTTGKEGVAAHFCL